jgi:hypothetical protein
MSLWGHAAIFHFLDRREVPADFGVGRRLVAGSSQPIAWSLKCNRRRVRYCFAWAHLP